MWNALSQYVRDQKRLGFQVAIADLFNTPKEASQWNSAEYRWNETRRWKSMLQKLRNPSPRLVVRHHHGVPGMRYMLEHVLGGVKAYLEERNCSFVLSTIMREPVSHARVPRSSLATQPSHDCAPIEWPSLLLSHALPFPVSRVPPPLTGPLAGRLQPRLVGRSRTLLAGAPPPTARVPRQWLDVQQRSEQVEHAGRRAHGGRRSSHLAVQLGGGHHGLGQLLASSVQATPLALR